MKQLESLTNVAGWSEKIPTKASVVQKFEAILEGKEFVDVKKEEDNLGLVAWDISAQTLDGERVDVTYERGRTFNVTTVVPSQIHVMILDANGFPAGAPIQYDYVDGQWQEVN